MREHHPYLAPAACVTTGIQGGEWQVTYPARCRIECHFEYLPEQADEAGWGSRVEREFEDWLARAAAADPWLRDHPPQVEWLLGGVQPAEVTAAEPIVRRCWRCSTSLAVRRSSAGSTTGTTARR